MHAGFAKANVTPPLGMAMEGLGQQGGCERIHDDLFVRALYLSHEGVRILILGCDLLFFERPEIAQIKGDLGKALGLTPEEIFLNFSHSHAGPRLTRWSYSGAPDPAYLARVARAFVQAAVEARAGQRRVTLQSGMAKTILPVCRRKPDGAGGVLWAPYHAGEICDAVPFCLFKAADGAVVSLLFSASCHPSMIYSLDFSAEYPGAAMAQLNARFRTEGSLFLQGAGGDAKPRQVAVNDDHWRQGTWEEMAQAGADVADPIVRAIEGGVATVTPQLGITHTRTLWPFDPLPPRASYEQVARDETARPERRLWAREMLEKLDATGALPTAVEVEMHGVQLGKGVRLVGLEGELVGPLGNLILRTYTQGITFPLGYSNGTQMYLPSSAMLPEGGYEVDSYWEYHQPARLAPGTEQIIVGTIRQWQGTGMLADNPV